MTTAGAPIDASRTAPAGVWVIVVATALALALRILGLGHESLWLDEVSSLRLARLPLGELIAQARGDVHPPLYFALLKGWIGLAGESEVALRALSALFGVLAVPLMARIGTRLGGPRCGGLAAMFVAGSAILLHYSQEARPYMLLALLSLVLVDRQLALLERPTVTRGLAWGASAAALLYTHNSGVFVVLALLLHGAVVFAADPRRRAGDARGWGVALPVAALLYAPWLGALRAQTLHVAAGFWVPVPRAIDLLKTAWEFAGSGPLLVGLGLLALIGLLRPPAPGAPPVPQARWLLLGWLLAPVLVPFVVSRMGPPIYVIRLALPAALALLLLAALGVAALGRAVVRSGVLALLALLAVTALVPYYRESHKESWRDATGAVLRAATPQDLVVIHPGFNRMAWDYYARAGGPPVIEWPPREGTEVSTSASSLMARAMPYPRVWLVLSRAQPAAAQMRAALAVGRHLGWTRAYTYRAYGLTRTRDWTGIEVLRFDR